MLRTLIAGILIAEIIIEDKLAWVIIWNSKLLSIIFVREMKHMVIY